VKGKRHLPVIAETSGGRAHRMARRACQALALVAVIASPFLGGWQRLERNFLSGWDGRAYDLPEFLLERLPGGELAARAYQANELLGGGVASRYVGVPFVDPAMAPSVLLTSELTLVVLLGVALPVLLGVLAGRAFCGWFCPFGTVSRIVESLLRRLPWRPKPLSVPTHRGFRHLLLGALWIASLVFGVHVVYLFLPHSLLQQSVYAVWLLGGGGAVLAWFLGLLSAGVILGPTAYCATVCPTGTLLSLLGRKKVVRVTLRAPGECGSHCTLCANACWLSLRPDQGDPGPDCDSCSRCFEVCPRTNLVVGLQLPKSTARSEP